MKTWDLSKNGGGRWSKRVEFPFSLAQFKWPLVHETALLPETTLPSVYMTISVTERKLTLLNFAHVENLKGMTRNLGHSARETNKAIGFTEECMGQKLYSRTEKSLVYLKHLPSRNPEVQTIPGAHQMGSRWFLIPRGKNYICKGLLTPSFFRLVLAPLSLSQSFEKRL